MVLNDMKTIIMAGGKGTRIQMISSEIPKPMLPIDGIPVLEREIISLRNQGFKDIIITVSHLGSFIMEYFKNGTDLGVKIEYFDEKIPLGNAGALFKLRSKIGNDAFLLLNADIVFDVDFNRMLDFHRKKESLITLFTHPNNHPYDSSLLVADENLSVKTWISKEDKQPVYYKNRVNAGLHIIEPIVLDMSGINVGEIGKKNEDGKILKVDLDSQLLKPFAGTGKMFCYDSPEYVKDMGTPERFYSVEKDFKSGKIISKNLKNKQKAVFLDRDGIINKYVGFLKKERDFELIPGVGEAIRKINESGYLCIVVTNQPVIARGEMTYSELDNIHNKMETLLGLESAYIDGLYYCPHHPDTGYDGEVSELKFDCSCRKPKPGMLLKAAKDFNIDLKCSWMAGDSENDIKAGLSAGCKSILINGYGTNKIDGNFGQVDTMDSLLLFVEKYIIDVNLAKSEKNI